MNFLKYLTAMRNNKAREINSPLIKQLIDETSPEELAKIDTDMTNNKQQIKQYHVEGGEERWNYYSDVLVKEFISYWVKLGDEKIKSFYSSKDAVDYASKLNKAINSVR
jgi:hypothetical protein